MPRHEVDFWLKSSPDDPIQAQMTVTVTGEGAEAGRGQHGQAAQRTPEGRRGRGKAPGATLNTLEPIWDTFGKIDF